MSDTASLQSIFGLLGAGRVADALKGARAFVARAPGSADGWHLLAMCLAEGGASDEARSAFVQALRRAPDHPQVLGNYGRWLRRTGRNDEALGVCRRLCEVAPASAPAWSELGIAALAAGQVDEACGALERAARIQPASHVTWHYAGSAYRAAGRLDQAEAALRRAVQIQGCGATTWINLGTVLRLQGRVAEAVPCFATAAEMGAGNPDLADAQAGALLDLGRVAEALGVAQAAAKRWPTHPQIHRTLGNILWEYDDPDCPGRDPLAGFAAAVEQAPGDRSLRAELACFLVEAGRAEEALAHIRRLRREADDPRFAFMEAMALDALGDMDGASSGFERLHAGSAKVSAAVPTAYARHLLKARRWDLAAAVAEEATLLDRGNQEAWAYLATAWRLLGDPRHAWLCDCEALVDLVEVEPPAGLDDPAGFLARLKAVIEPMHRARREPVHQSLRGGSQTPGRLFGRGDPTIALAETALRQAVARWTGRLGMDPRHPFLGRRPPAIRFAGAWSVKLWSSGRHVNHIHPQGWASSAFYVHLPPTVAAGEGGLAGCLQLGQPPTELGLDLPPLRIIRPRVGALALFPSYMWHGTVPFVDDEPRLTIAFDVAATA